jgi:hypothetical protein
MDNPITPPHFTVQGDRFGIDLWRISYHQYEALKERSFRVDIDSKILFYLFQKEYEKPEAEQFTLPKVLVTLEALFGESSTHYDDSRQTFAFHCFLRLRKDGHNLPYLLNIADYRGSVSFWLYRIIDHKKFFDLDVDRSQKAVPDELDLDNIAYLIYGIWFNLAISGNAICAEKINHQTLHPFFRDLSCNYLIYGYVDNAFFEEELDNERKYRTAVAKLNAKCEHQYIPVFQHLPETQAIIQAATNSMPKQDCTR